MEGPIRVALIDRWIADYYSHLIWKHFEKGDCFSSLWVRDHILGHERTGKNIITDEQLKDDEEATFSTEVNPRLLIDLMYKISFGEKLFEDFQKSRSTFLEEAIEILDTILSVSNLCNRLSRDSVLRLKLLLKQQAVLVCCKKNEFDLAREVFVREWRHWKNENEIEVRQKISEVIEQRNSDHRYFDLMPYSSLIDGSRTFLSEIFSTLRTPFLVTAAQNASSCLNSIKQTYFCSKSQNLSHNINQAFNNGNAGTHSPGPTTVRNPKQKKHGQCAETEAHDTSCSAIEPGQNSDSEVSHSADTARCKSVRGNSPESAAGSSRDVRKSVKKLKAECSNSSKMGLKEEKQDLPNESSNRMRKWREPSPDYLDWEAELDSAVLTSPESRPRKAWLLQEEEQLYLAVQKFGVGQWRKVADFLRSSRSNVDVKDKWRTMTKQGKLKTFEKRFGPIAT